MAAGDGWKLKREKQWLERYYVISEAAAKMKIGVVWRESENVWLWKLAWRCNEMAWKPKNVAWKSKQSAIEWQPSRRNRGNVKPDTVMKTGNEAAWKKWRWAAEERKRNLLKRPVAYNVA